MLPNRRSIFFAGLLIACLCGTGKAVISESGQRNFAQASVEPAFDDSTGNTVYLLTPINAPFPSKANPKAVSPLYIPMYPVTSTVSASDLNCQPTNCDHLNVLPFHFSGYTALPGSNQACVDFNGGEDCSLVKGHDHLVGVPRSGGDFNVAWHVELVVFTSKAFADGKINTRITTDSQIDELVASHDAVIVDTPITFNCQITAERTYDLGTPVVIPFP